MNAQSTGDWLLTTLKKNPEGLLLLGAGLTLLMRNSSHGQAHAAHRAAQPVAARQSAHSHSWKQGVAEATESVRDYAAETAASFGEYASEGASKASLYAEDMKDRGVNFARNAEHSIRRTVQERPFAIALAGLAAGCAIAAILPLTRIEEDTLRPAGERVSETAGHIAERLKEATARAGERLSTAANERGLNKEGLSEVAKDVAGAFKSGFSDESINPTPERQVTHPDRGV